MNVRSQAFASLLIHRVCGLLLAVLVSAACAAPATTVPSRKELETLFADALHCRTNFPDGREDALARHLRAQGVTVVDRAPGELLDLLYIFAPPLDIDGTQVYSITVRGGSGSIVAARATGNLQTLVRHNKARPHPASQWNLDGFGELPAQYSRSMPVRPGLDETPPRLVMGHVAGDAPHTLRWGCRSYDN